MASFWPLNEFWCFLYSSPCFKDSFDTHEGYILKVWFLTSIDLHGLHFDLNWPSKSSVTALIMSNGFRMFIKMIARKYFEYWRKHKKFWFFEFGQPPKMASRGQLVKDIQKIPKPG